MQTNTVILLNILRAKVGIISLTFYRHGLLLVFPSIGSVKVLLTVELFVHIQLDRLSILIAELVLMILLGILLLFALFFILEEDCRFLAILVFMVTVNMSMRVVVRFLIHAKKTFLLLLFIVAKTVVGASKFALTLFRVG